MRKGFTLIEILVVIGIFGILLSTFLFSVTGVRRSARDNRRIADLKAVQQGLQLYHIKCGMFPGRYDSSAGCVGGFLNSAPAADKGPLDWLTLSQTLSGAPIGFGEVPFDPLPGASYSYHVQLGNPPNTPRAQCYLLHAVLETDHRALTDDLDDGEVTGSLLPSSLPGIHQKNLYPNVASGYCDESAGTRNYCVGNIECFHGF